MTDDPAAHALDRARILIVEDEVLLALDLEDFLTDKGVSVLGPVPTVAKALDALSMDRPDAVCLDMNLRGELSFPIAAELRRQGIPFVVVSGYSDKYAKEDLLKDSPFVKKPYNKSELLTALRSVLTATIS